MKKYSVLFILWTFLIVLDQWTKHLISLKFKFGESLSIIENYFNLVHARNTGAAFSMFADADSHIRVPLFILLPVIASVVMIILIKRLPKEDWKNAIGLIMVCSGAIGNLIDRVRLGYVIDFLDFHWKNQAHFPAFNVADSAICVGVALLMLDFGFLKQKQTRKV
jgi:signal peptidase II